MQLLNSIKTVDNGNIKCSYCCALSTENAFIYTPGIL